MKQNESEADDKGPRFLTEIDPDEGMEYVLVYGADAWRTPWTY